MASPMKWSFFCLFSQESVVSPMKQTHGETFVGEAKNRILKLARIPMKHALFLLYRQRRQKQALGTAALCRRRLNSFLGRRGARETGRSLKTFLRSRK
jgi:hypothetical protein